MVKAITAFFLLLFAGTSADVPSSSTQGNSSILALEDAYDEVMSEALTSEGLVRYDYLAESERFAELVRLVEDFDFEDTVGDAERLAFWMNAYNVHMLNKMTARPRRRNVLGLDLGLVFFKTKITVAGESLTLDKVEHGILRKGDEDLADWAPSRLDPRIHVGLNCAAVSCPRLWPEAFRAARIDDQLDRAMRHFVDSPDKFAVEEDRLVASSLLKWYGDDFDTTGIPAGDFLLSYMSPDRPDHARLVELMAGRSADDLRSEGARFRYNWSVNRAR